MCRLTAARLPQHRHTPYIPAKRPNVALHPLQGLLLVENAVVAADTTWVGRTEGWVGEEAKGGQSIVERHQHNLARLSQPLQIDIFRREPRNERACVLDVMKARVRGILAHRRAAIQ